ncbi:hypothetical protein VKS41_002402 [Umbelopsis sp. WA50703]
MTGRPRGRPSRRRLRLIVKEEKSNSDLSANEDTGQSADETTSVDAKEEESKPQEPPAPRRRGRPRIYPRPGEAPGEPEPPKKRRRDDGDSTDDDGEDDPDGEQKIDRQGHLLGEREFRVPTFELPERGDQQLMFAMEPARILGYRDSYLLFMKNPDLVRVRISDEAKTMLVEQKMLLPWFRNRDVAIVTARSIFKVFGAKVIKRGRRCKDDYYEARSRAEGYTDELEDTEMEEALGRRTQLSSHTAKLPGSNVPSTAVSGPGWMYHAALSVQEFNSRLRDRREEKVYFYDVHTNVQQLPSATQPSSCEFECIDPKKSDGVVVDPVRFDRPPRPKGFFENQSLDILDTVDHQSIYDAIPPDIKQSMKASGVDFFKDKTSDIFETKDGQYPIALLDGQHQETIPIHHVRFAINAPKIFSPVSITKATRTILTQQQLSNSKYFTSNNTSASLAGTMAANRSPVPPGGLDRRISGTTTGSVRLNSAPGYQYPPTPQGATSFVCGYISDNGHRCPIPVANRGERCPHHANNYAKLPPSIAKTAIQTRSASPSAKQGNVTENKCADCHYLSAPSEVTKGITQACDSFTTIKCTNCNKKYHPACAHIKTPRQIAAVESYPWLCPDCKICCVCQTVGDESTLMICDDCDRGWHTNCCKPKVDEVPEGAWRCPLCALCHSCGGKEIKNENKQKHPYQHAVAPATEHYKYPVYLATYCKVCDDNFENDRFCPVCLKTYSEDEDEEKEDENNDMVACDNCDYWVHVDCDEALTPERYQKLCENENEKYNCPLCDGRVQPITHTGHAALALKGVSAPSGSCVGVVGGKVKVRGVVHYRKHLVGVPEINGTGVAVAYK